MNERAIFPFVQNPPVSLATLPNDTGRAARFVETYGENIRFVHEWKMWLIWDGNRWRRDRDGGIMRLVKEFCLLEFKRALADHPSDPKAATEARREAAEIGDKAQAERMLKMAESDSRVIAHPEALDADPWLLGTGNGVIELRTGKFRSGRRDDLITKATGTPYDAEAKCPRFEQFIREIFESDRELAEFVSRALGYSLTGDTSEQGFFFLHGSGSNGKSRLVETILALLGEYGATTAPEVVALTKTDTPMHHLADLHGARFITLPETEETHRLAESRIKSLTGGDEVTACRKYEHPFRFRPQLKLWIHGNHKPEIRGTDNGIWRRVKLIPFDSVFTTDKRDPVLQLKLAAELPGILNYLIEACLTWQSKGLSCPATVKSATDGYRTEQDVLAEFLEDETIEAAAESVSRADLYARYSEWAKAQGILNPWSERAIAKNLRERGFRGGKTNGMRKWLGLALR